MIGRYTNWRDEYYHNAKKEGFKYCVRENIQMFSDEQPSWHKLKNKEELWQLPFIRQRVEKFKNYNFKKWKFRDSEKGSEQDLIYCESEGETYLVAYVMDLEKFEGKCQPTYDSSKEVDEVRKNMQKRDIKYWESKLELFKELGYSLSK